MKSKDELDGILNEPRKGPAKTYSQLLAEGVPHEGGLAQLAAAEIAEDPHPAIAALQLAAASKARH